MTTYEEQTKIILAEAAHMEGWFTLLDLSAALDVKHGVKAWHSAAGDRLWRWTDEGQLTRRRKEGKTAYEYRWVDPPEARPYDVDRKTREDVMREVQRRLQESDVPALSVLRIAGVTYDVIYDFNYGTGLFPDRDHMPAKGTAGTPLHQETGENDAVDPG